ncbi:MAG: radical SAM protein [Chitinivibrionia bacterium]|nr:radical SAM protein [Chitinivibrionia bacterium]
MELSRPKYAALCLTHNCNLRCTYCYSGHKLDRSMTPETAMLAIDFLHDPSGGSCTITFFGGEPLLEIDLIKDLVSYSRSRYKDRVKFRMSTNGTLLDRSVLEYLRMNDVYFVLSLDGSKQQHDRCRRFAGGSGTYEKIACHFERVLQLNPYTMAVSVIVPETAEYLASGVRDLFAKGFRYVVQTLDYSAPWRKSDVKVLKRQYESLAAFYHDSLRTGRKIYYSPFDERIKTRAQKRYGRGDLCDLAHTQIAIAPSGRIYPCVQFVGLDEILDQAYSIGSVHDGFDNARRRCFVDENYADKEACAGCALEGRCATYCGCVNWRATGSLRTIPPIICEHERMLMPIVDRLASKLWKESNPLFKHKFYERSFPVSSYLDDCMLTREA